MFRLVSPVALACTLGQMSDAAHGHGPPFSQRGQAMNARGRTIRPQMAAQGQVMEARGPGHIEDVQEWLLEQRFGIPERQAASMRELAERLRERGDVELLTLNWHRRGRIRRYNGRGARAHRTPEGHTPLQGAAALTPREPTTRLGKVAGVRLPPTELAAGGLARMRAPSVGPV